MLNKRTILKSISWRITAMITTIPIVLILTGDISLALQVGVVEVVAKLIVYYIHERIWE